MPRTRHRLRADAIDSIRTLVAGLARSARSVERRTGVTNAQLFVLRQIAERQGISLGALAGQTLTRQSTVSTVLGRLVDQGLVRRTRARDDRRRLELSLTAAGLRVLRDAPEAPTGRLLAALDTLTTAQLTAIASGLGALLVALRLERRSATMLFEG